MPTQQAESRGTQGLETLCKAFKLVDEIQARRGATLSELTAELNMPKSTIHVYLLTLEREGYLVRRDGTYHVGLQFLSHAGHARKQTRFYEAAKLEVDKLAERTGEVANFGTEQNGKRVLVYKHEHEEGIYDNSITGEFTFMHWTALGKSMLAQFSDDRIETILDQHGMPQATDHTITDRDELWDELQRIRDQGYAVGNEEHRMGVVSIAVALTDSEYEDSVSAISISGPKNRICDGETVDRQLIQEVKSSANVIELRYNHY